MIDIAGRGGPAQVSGTADPSSGPSICGVGSALWSKRMCGFGACTEFLVAFAAPSSSPQVCAVFAVLRARYFRVPPRAVQKAGDATDGRRYVVAANLGTDSMLVR